jgi:hypothetical protein
MEKSFKEITCGQLIKLHNCSDDIEALSVLTGIELDEIYNLEALKVAELMKEAEAFEADIDPSDFEFVKRLTINGKQLQIPDNLDGMTFGQKIMIDNYCANMELNEYEKSFYIYSIIVSPIYYGCKFDEAKVQEFYDLVLHEKTKHIFGAALFFWIHTTKLLIEKLMRSAEKEMQSISKQEPENSNSSELSQPLTS